MFWTIFFAVLAAMCVPVLVAWAAMSAAGIASYLATLRARNSDALEYWLWFGGVVICIGTAIALASGR